MKFTRYKKKKKFNHKKFKKINKFLEYKNKIFLKLYKKYNLHKINNNKNYKNKEI